MCMPGDNVEMTIELIHPVSMEQGLRFASREGGRTVGSGRVATVSYTHLMEHSKESQTNPRSQQSKYSKRL